MGLSLSFSFIVLYTPDKIDSTLKKQQGLYSIHISPLAEIPLTWLAEILEIRKGLIIWLFEFHRKEGGWKTFTVLLQN